MSIVQLICEGACNGDTLDYVEELRRASIPSLLRAESGDGQHRAFIRAMARFVQVHRTLHHTPHVRLANPRGFPDQARCRVCGTERQY